jgi:hypothetical protein
MSYDEWKTTDPDAEFLGDNQQAGEMNDEEEQEGWFARYEERCAKLNKFIGREFAGLSHHDVCEVLRTHIQDGFGSDDDAYFAQVMLNAAEDFTSFIGGDFNDWIEAAIKAWLKHQGDAKLSTAELLALIDHILHPNDPELDYISGLF